MTHHATVHALLFLAVLYPLLFSSVCIALPAGADDPKMISRQRFAHVPMSTLPRPKTFEILDSPGTDICTSVVGSGRGGRVPANTHIHIRYALFDLKHYDKFDHKGWGDEKHFGKPGFHDDDDSHIDRRRLSNVYTDDYYYGGSGEEDFGHHEEEEEARRLEQLGLEQLEREKKDKEAREASQRLLIEERQRAQQEEDEKRRRAQQEEDEKRKRALEEDQRRIREDDEKRKEEGKRKEDEKQEEDERQRLAWEEEKLRRRKDEEQRREWEEEKRRRATAEGAKGESLKDQIKQPDGGEEGRPSEEMERKELPTPPLSERSRHLLEEDERQAASRASEIARRDALKENMKQTDPRKEGRQKDYARILPTPPLPKSPEERQAEQTQRQKLPPPQTREDMMKNREGAETPKKIERVEPRLPPDLHDKPRVPGIPHDMHKKPRDSLNNALPSDMQDRLKNGKHIPEEIPPDVYMEDDTYAYDAGFDDLDEDERERFVNSHDRLKYEEEDLHALGGLHQEQSEQASKLLNGLYNDKEDFHRKMEAEEFARRKHFEEAFSAREEKKPSSSGVHIESGATVAALSKIDKMKERVATGVDHQGDLRITVFQRPHDSQEDDVVVANRQNVRNKAIHNFEGTLTYITNTEATVDICVRSTYASKQHPSRIGYTVSYGHDESFYELRRAMSFGSHSTEEDIVMQEMYNEIRELEYDVRVVLFATQESKQEEAVLRAKVEKFYASARWWPIIEILVLVVVGIYQSFHLMCFFKKKTKAY